MEGKRYSAEFKREAVKLASQPGKVKRQVAEELGIHENLLGTWVRQFAAGKWEVMLGTALKSDQELERLRRELKRVTTERDILKNGGGLLREGTLVRYGFVVRH